MRLILLLFFTLPALAQPPMTNVLGDADYGGAPPVHQFGYRLNDVDERGFSLDDPVGPDHLVVYMVPEGYDVGPFWENPVGLTNYRVRYDPRFMYVIHGLWTEYGRGWRGGDTSLGIPSRHGALREVTTGVQPDPHQWLSWVYRLDWRSTKRTGPCGAEGAVCWRDPHPHRAMIPPRWGELVKECDVGGKSPYRKPDLARHLYLFKHEVGMYMSGYERQVEWGTHVTHDGGEVQPHVVPYGECREDYMRAPVGSHGIATTAVCDNLDLNGSMRVDEDHPCFPHFWKRGPLRKIGEHGYRSTLRWWLPHGYPDAGVQHIDYRPQGYACGRMDHEIDVSTQRGKALSRALSLVAAWGRAGVLTSVGVACRGYDIIGVGASRTYSRWHRGRQTQT